MLDPTPSRNLKSFGAKAASHVARRISARNRRASLAAFAGVFLAAAMAWIVMDWAVFRVNAPKRVLPDLGEKAHLARVDAQVKEILERPLFTGDRSPPPPPPTPEQLAAARRPVLKSHLTGITILTHVGAADTRVALFAGDGNQYVSVKEGEEIDGFKVKSIEANRVILASPFSEQIVQPSKGLAPTVRNTKQVDLSNFDADKPDQKQPLLYGRE